MSRLVRSVEDLQERLAAQKYLASRGLATALYLAMHLPQPLLLEGEPGVGKSELARALAAALGCPFFRLQCYEGIDRREALYDWNYLRQILELRRVEATSRGAAEINLFSEKFLIPGPLMRALQGSDGHPSVLLIDELDRADEAFEAFLLEFLGDYAITVPELGTIRPVVPPLVVITSNRTRELHDALKRRCLYHWVDYPTVEEEMAILRLRVPEAPADLTRAVAEVVRRLRALDLQKPPGIAEALALVRAVQTLGQSALTPGVVEATLGVVVKNRDDLERVRAHVLDGVEGGRD